MFDIVKVAKDAKKASYSYGLLDTNTKNAALLAVAKSLRENEDKIFSVNAVDVENAKKAGYSEALVDRLTITKARFEEMVGGVEKVVKLSDPVGRIYDGRTVTLQYLLRRMYRSSPEPLSSGACRTEYPSDGDRLRRPACTPDGQ